jgi:hypothetical protein
MSETPPQKIERISMLVFPRLLFVLSHLQVRPSDGSSKAQQKAVYKQKIVSESFTKQSTKTQNRFFLDLDFVLSRFGAFLVERNEFKNTIKKKNSKRNLALVLFWPLTYLATYLPTHGGPKSQGAAEKIKRKNDVYLRKLAKKGTHVLPPPRGVQKHEDKI